jgi:hypothetical protein
LEEDEEVQEDRILQAAKHAEAVCKQRQLVNCKIDQAHEDHLASISHSGGTYTLIADYGQNMQLPFFGEISLEIPTTILLRVYTILALRMSQPQVGRNYLPISTRKVMAKRAATMF